MIKQSRLEAEKHLREQLQIMSDANGIKTKGYKYTSPSALLLKIGESMGGKETGPDTDLVELIERLEYHAIKQCYYNCAMLAPYADWNYCEGYVMKENLMLPILHAWLELDGVVYDPTIREKNTSEEKDIGARLTNNNERNFYFGVKLNKEVVHADLFKRGESFSVLQDWQKHWPVLKENSPWLL